MSEGWRRRNDERRRKTDWRCLGRELESRREEEEWGEQEEEEEERKKGGRGKYEGPQKGRGEEGRWCKLQRAGGESQGLATRD